MKIKNIVMSVVFVLGSGSILSAQTPEEIIEKMSTEMKRGETEGFQMDLYMKLPIVGTISSHNMVLGKKVKAVVSSSDNKTVSWQDEKTKWSYDEKTNEITITAREQAQTQTAEAENGADVQIFNSVTKGYDCQITEENADTWYIVCNKAKSNKVKDAPKKMDIAVAKATYLPVYLRTKKSVVSISIENYTLGVSEESVLFDKSEYPNAKIVDKR
jgi:outer membrane lipoprotein-sorting protein